MPMAPSSVYLSIQAVTSDYQSQQCTARIKHVVPTLKDSPYDPVLRKYLNTVISTKLLVILASNIIPGGWNNQDIF